MSSESDARARKRRSGNWHGGTARSFEEAEKADYKFWQTLSGSERLSAALQMALEALIIQGKDGAAPRLQRSAVGTRKR